MAYQRPTMTFEEMKAVKVTSSASILETRLAALSGARTAYFGGALNDYVPTIGDRIMLEQEMAERERVLGDSYIDAMECGNVDWDRVMLADVLQ